MILNQKSGLLKGVIIINGNRCELCGNIIPEGRMECPKCDNIEPSFETIKITVLLDRITDIRDFVNLASMCQDDVVVKSGHYSVCAKSIMALCSLDLTKPLKVEFYGNIPYEVREGMKKFIVD